MNDRFVLHDDGVWMYHLGADIPTVYGGGLPVPEADGQPMIGLQAPGWWATDHEAATITVRRSVPPATTGYRLRDDSAASTKFPAALTPDEWENHDADRDLLWDLYTTVTEPQPDVVIAIDGPWLRLDGTPPPDDDSRTWVPRLPDALRNRPEYHHLFPGHMPGFRDHIKRLAERHRHVEHVFTDYQGRRGLTVILKVPFDQPVTEYRPARNNNGSVSRSRKGRTVTVYARRELLLDVHDRTVIQGDARAEAAARWDEQTAHYTALLDEASVAACSHCKGHGYVPSGAEAVSRG
ncbi:hypothetical protein [Actinomadura bangladeshensis]|uniref:Uncharacterized protein n=1 Tax=Actinomadura bangladeshensis TaxID=453573 RepID=A0A6L9QB66_9ACTN|nr:hypothetical protein [Actinomadura bangladeshensis]NEA22641.1 hypothetical protein [Actinomadura bangladeshensis]